MGANPQENLWPAKGDFHNVHKPSLSLDFAPSFIRFCESLSCVCEISDFLPALKAHLPKKFKTGEWVLFYNSLTGPRRAYIRKNRFYEEEAEEPWPPLDGIQSSNRQIQVYMAQEMGRLFAGGLVVPLACKGQSPPPLLFVERHAGGKRVEELLTAFLGQAVPLLQTVFKKALLNTEAKKASDLWRGLFTHWTEPLAILKGFSPIRMNHSFQKLLSLCPDFLYKRPFSSPLWLNGRLYHICYYPVSQFKGPAGILYCQDITEKNRLKEQISQSGKMAALAVLGKGAGQSLNSRLADLRRQARALSQAPGLSRFREEFVALEEATAQAQTTAQNLLSFSQTDKKQGVCDLNEAIKAALPLVKSAIGDISLDIRLFPSSLKVRGEADLLRHVVCNLILNACQALRARGNSDAAGGGVAVQALQVRGNPLDRQAVAQGQSHILRARGARENLWKNESYRFGPHQALRAREATAHKPPCIAVSVGRADKNQAVLKVRDNGPGIAPENLKKIFQPLWSDKKAQGGTGLGLSLARRLVRQMGGEIFVFSREHDFTCFSVLLPLVFPKSQAGLTKGA